MHSSETLQELLSSVHNNSLHTQISSFNSGDLIHIHGHPASGKTHLLYYLLATCILPGGWNKAAIVFDMDGKFNISRFNQLLVGRLNLSSEAITTIVERCLKHLHIFRPTSSDQLLVTLAHLHKYHAKHFPDIALGMVAIHSVDAFYWPDRFKTEQLRLANLPHSSLQNISSILEAIRLSLGSVVVLTDWGLIQQRQTGVSQYAYNPQVQDNIHPNFPHIHQITLSVMDTKSDDPEYRHALGVVKVPGRAEIRKFTLRIRPKALSIDVE